METSQNFKKTFDEILKGEAVSGSIKLHNGAYVTQTHTKKETA